ncbi:hypothetical protein SUGI_0805770 [Cryptomeria japonica]|nr:hypothetical protein SUGI_0805770 [Cryptomeria japonica]
MEGNVQIYPRAQGFFVVIFDKVEDRNKVFYTSLWSWEEKHSLLLKLWYQAFSPIAKSFDQTLIWVRLPNLPLQFWLESYFKVVGDSLESLG